MLNICGIYTTALKKFNVLTYFDKQNVPLWISVFQKQFGPKTLKSSHIFSAKILACCPLYNKYFNYLYVDQLRCWSVYFLLRSLTSNSFAVTCCAEHFCKTVKHEYTLHDTLTKHVQCIRNSVTINGRSSCNEPILVMSNENLGRHVRVLRCKVAERFR